MHKYEVNYIIFWGEGGRSSKYYIGLQGGGGGMSRRLKKGLRNFLMVPKIVVA